MIELFAADKEPYHVTLAETLEEILKVVSWDSPITARLANAPNCTKLMDHIFDPNNLSASKYGTQVFNAMLSAYSAYINASVSGHPLTPPLILVSLLSISQLSNQPPLSLARISFSSSLWSPLPLNPTSTTFWSIRGSLLTFLLRIRNCHWKHL
jgi:hypothetical protein